MITIRYFASLRERLGLDSEELALPAGISDMAGLAAHLAARGEPWAEAFAPNQSLMMALNQESARGDVLIKDGDEVAFFPPVTGG